MRKETAAFKAGLFVDGNNIFRSDFPIDYKALYDHAMKEHNLLRANAYIVVDPDNPEKSRPFVHFLMSTGFRVVQRPLIRTPDGGVRASTSVALAVDLLSQAQNLDVIVLVSGDGNLIPAVEQLQKMGRRVEVIAFADRSSKDLQDHADFFFPLQKVENIQREHVPRDDYDGNDDMDGGPGGSSGDGDGGGRGNKSPEEM